MQREANLDVRLDGEGRPDESSLLEGETRKKKNTTRSVTCRTVPKIPGGKTTGYRVGIQVVSESGEISGYGGTCYEV